MLVSARLRSVRPRPRYRRAAGIQAAINAAASTLPRNLPYPPVYAKVNPADAPVLTLSLTSKTSSLREMSDLADTLIAQRLSQISGVGSVAIQGGIRPAIRIQADLARLAAYGMGPEDLRVAIVAANVAGPKGALDGTHQAYTIGANDQILAAEAYRDIIVAYPTARRSCSATSRASSTGWRTARGGWYQGVPAVSSTSSASRRQRHRTVKLFARAAALGATPAGVIAGGATAPHDPRLGARRAVHLVLAVALVVLVVLVFLRTLRATIIAGIRCRCRWWHLGVMWFCGFSAKPVC